MTKVALKAEIKAALKRLEKKLLDNSEDLKDVSGVTLNLEAIFKLESKQESSKREYYYCPTCDKLQWTCTEKGRQGFARTPGRCSRHPQVDMIKGHIDE